MHNWYHAALFCLDRADYLRTPDIRSVQAIAILQLCCGAAGDGRLRRRLIAVGISLSNDLGLPFGPDSGHSIVHRELSRQWWWMFVASEW